MALIDTKLRTIVNNSYTGSPELTDGDGLRVRITQKGTITFQFCYTWQNIPSRIYVVNVFYCLSKITMPFSFPCHSDIL